ncbi:hypothetical protein K7432_005312 [Basidiobolus ranarum]|uniref:C2H2-type domain-containing protein n=1 Tax=Basidiobolus ranarum TaxID=34480 RepID=A0ABR2WWR0_9FUNG
MSHLDNYLIPRKSVIERPLSPSSKFVHVSLSSDTSPWASKDNLQIDMKLEQGIQEISKDIDGSSSSNLEEVRERNYVPHELQVEAIFLKALSELYEKDVLQSIKLLDEILLHGIQSPRLVTIYRFIFTMLSANYTNSHSNTTIKPTVSPPISLQSDIYKSIPSEVQIIVQRLPINDHQLRRKEESMKSKESLKIWDKVKQSRGREFICLVCGKPFDRPSALESHRKTHSQVREFACILCSRAFKFKHDMERHLRKHTGEKPYPCWYCKQGFYRSDTLTNHMKNKHPNT